MRLAFEYYGNKDAVKYKQSTAERLEQLNEYIYTNANLISSFTMSCNGVWRWSRLRQSISKDLRVCGFPCKQTPLQNGSPHIHVTLSLPHFGCSHEGKIHMQCDSFDSIDFATICLPPFFHLLVACLMLFAHLSASKANSVEKIIVMLIDSIRCTPNWAATDV